MDSSNRWPSTFDVRPGRPLPEADVSRRQSKRATPIASSSEVRRRMQAVRRVGTDCELMLRTVLRRRRLSFATDWPIPGTRRRADLVFRKARVAVFIDGCFWHACPRHASWPKQNASWWRQKILGNVARDRDTDRYLRRIGWKVVRVWEHTSPNAAAARIVRHLSAVANAPSNHRAAHPR